MELRELTRENRTEIAELFLSVFTAEPWNDDWSDGSQFDAYLNEFIDRSALMLGYYDDDRLIGLCIGYIKHWYAGTEYCIDEFCIDRNLQGQGIGSHFMDAIEEYLRNREIYQIYLQTERTVKAYQFYTSRGFHELKDHVSMVKDIRK